jgi:chemotaxis signal transduction protein
MKIAPNKSPAARGTGRTEPVILFLVSGQTFAISASAVHEIRSTDSLSGTATEISHSPVPKVGHLLRRGRRAYYVVNACEHFRLPASRPTLVLVLRSVPVAILVDRIDRMEAMSLLMALPHAFCGAERVWYRGITLMDEDVVPVLNPAGFLTEQQSFLLEAVLAAGDSAADENERAMDRTPADEHGVAMP